MKKTIDATNRTIGRVATEAAMVLMGKDMPNYRPNVVSEVEVIIENASKTKITEKKMNEKEYKKYSGYPGGLKHESLKKIIENKGYAEVYKNAIKGMLPANRLRDLRLKNLQITD